MGTVRGTAPTDPIKPAHTLDRRMHELRDNATRGGHPPSPAASDVVDVRYPAFCVAPGLDLALCAWASRSQTTFSEAGFTW